MRILWSGSEKALTWDDGKTALIRALEARHEGAVKLLVDKGADIEAAGDDMTALSIAASLGQEGVITLLLDRGAIVDKKDSKGYTALMLAAQWGKEASALILPNKPVEKSTTPTKLEDWATESIGFKCGAYLWWSIGIFVRVSFCEFERLPITERVD
jgi:Ankyrin repeats (3 copies)